MNTLSKLLATIACLALLTACGKTTDTGTPPLNDDEQASPPIEQPNDNDKNDEVKQPTDEIEEPEAPVVPVIPPVEETPPPQEQILIENEAFKIFSPQPGSDVTDQIVVRGTARIFEAQFKYEFEDGHFILDEGYIMASEGAPGWGDFEFIINIDMFPPGHYKIVLYEESGKDGSMQNTLLVPVVIP